MKWLDFSVVVGFRGYCFSNREFGILSKSLRQNNALLILAEIGKIIIPYSNYHPSEGFCTAVRTCREEL